MLRRSKTLLRDLPASKTSPHIRWAWMWPAAGHQHTMYLAVTKDRAVWTHGYSGTEGYKWALPVPPVGDEEVLLSFFFSFSDSVARRSNFHIGCNPNNGFSYQIKHYCHGTCCVSSVH